MQLPHTSTDRERLIGSVTRDMIPQTQTVGETGRGNTTSDIHCTMEPANSSTYNYGTVKEIEEFASTDDEMESILHDNVGISRFYPERSSLLQTSTPNASMEEGAGAITPDDTYISERMRTRLRYYFMNPLEKWEAKRQFPYKLTVQLIKIILVTLQLILFGSYRYASVNYIYDNRITFSHLFIKDWDSGREITSYPPNTGPLAVYTVDAFYSYVDHAIKAYYVVSNSSIGPYHYHKHKDGSIMPINVTVVEYAAASIVPSNDSFIFDTTTVKRSIEIPKVDLETFSSRSYFHAHNFSINFITLLELEIKFNLRTIRFRDLGPLKTPDCFTFEIDILFLNMDHDGQILISLDSNPVKYLCKGQTKFPPYQLENIGRSLMNYTVVVICALSLFLCCRAIYRAQQLKVETIEFFRKYFDKDLTIHERLNFFNGWYFLIVFNDILIIIGSAVKEEIETKELQSDAWNVCSICLGIGNLLVWFGVLRYLGFFKTYNVLIVTLKRATPNVLRFLLCAVLIYAGFVFCGWLILGPYHLKFSTLSTTSECLFALINGDDMFATFAALAVKSPFLWWFCRIYLYTFTSLFIYVVLSLFIALIMDAYETIKLFYSEGFPRSALEEFVIGPNDLNNSTDSFSHTQGHTTLGSHNIQMCHHFHSHLHGPGRKISAAGMLDTILENICGCSTPKATRSNPNLAGSCNLTSTQKSTSDVDLVPGNTTNIFLTH